MQTIPQRSYSAAGHNFLKKKNYIGVLVRFSDTCTGGIYLQFLGIVASSFIALAMRANCLHEYFYTLNYENMCPNQYDLSRLV